MEFLFGRTRQGGKKISLAFHPYQNSHPHLLFLRVFFFLFHRLLIPSRSESLGGEMRHQTRVWFFDREDRRNPTNPSWCVSLQWISLLNRRKGKQRRIYYRCGGKGQRRQRKCKRLGKKGEHTTGEVTGQTFRTSNLWNRQFFKCKKSLPKPFLLCFSPSAL